MGACAAEPAEAPPFGSLQQAFGLPRDVDLNDVSQLETEHDLVEAGISVCMQELGFDYTPAPFDSAGLPVFSDADERAAYESDGFGISLAWGDPAFGSTLGRFGDTPERDVNYEYRETLSEPELAAYESALEGDAGSEPGTDGASEDLSCYGQARGDVVGDRDERTEVVYSFRVELEERLSADRRVLSMHDMWRRCMADSGYTFDTVDEMYEYLDGAFSDQLIEVLGFDPQERPVLGAGEELPPDVDPEALTALHVEERRLAVTQFDCSEGAYRDIEAVRESVELEYVTSNADRILEAIGEFEAGR